MISVFIQIYLLRIFFGEIVNTVSCRCLKIKILNSHILKPTILPSIEISEGQVRSDRLNLFPNLTNYQNYVLSLLLLLKIDNNYSTHIRINRFVFSYFTRTHVYFHTFFTNFVNSIQLLLSHFESFFIFEISKVGILTFEYFMR